MDNRDLEVMMLQMELWPYRQATAEDKADDKRAEEAKLAAARYDAYGELARALWGDSK